MSFTEEELINIVDHLRSAGFELDDKWDQEVMALLADCVLEALHIEKE